MDEQLLFKEREVASWTRQRTSYCMMFPTRLPVPGNPPAECTSVLIPENLPSEKKHSLLTIASLRNKSMYISSGLEHGRCPLRATRNTQHQAHTKLSTPCQQDYPTIRLHTAGTKDEGGHSVDNSEFTQTGFQLKLLG